MTVNTKVPTVIFMLKTDCFSKAFTPREIFFSPFREKACKWLQVIEKLRGCDAHYTVILPRIDEKTHKALGIHATSEPKYEVKPV